MSQGHAAGPLDEQNFAIAAANLIVVALAEDDRRRALSRVAESDARARLIVDTAHDAFIGMDSAGTHRRLERAGGSDVRLDAATRPFGRNLADTIIPPAFREAHNNGMRRFHDTGEAPVRQPAAGADRAAPQRPRVPGRDDHHLADAASTTAFSSARSCATSQIGASATPSCAGPRNRPRRRRAPRASSSPT